MKDNCACHTDRTGCDEVQEFMALMGKIMHPPAQPTDEQLRGKRCWLYARVAGRPDDEHAILALESQLDRLRRFANEHEMQVAGTTQEAAAGCSMDNRPGLLELRRAAVNNEMDYVLARCLDRLIRSPGIRDYLQYEEELLGLGVGILCTDDWPHNPNTEENQ